MIVAGWTTHPSTEFARGRSDARRKSPRATGPPAGRRRGDAPEGRGGDCPRPGRRAGRRRPGQPGLRPQQAEGLQGRRDERGGRCGCPSTRPGRAAARRSTGSTPTRRCTASSSSCPSRGRSTSARSSSGSTRSKDVDGFHPLNVGLLARRDPAVRAVHAAGHPRVARSTRGSRRAARTRSFWAARRSSASRWRCCCCRRGPGATRPSPSATPRPATRPRSLARPTS